LSFIHIDAGYRKASQLALSKLNDISIKIDKADKEKTRDST
jgi:hypothetical protein